MKGQSMSGELLPYDDKIKERFVNFYDGVIFRIELKYHYGSKPTLAIDIVVRDAFSASFELLTNVRIIVNEVHEVKIKEGGNFTIAVLSQGLNVLRKHNLVAVEFGGLDEPGTIDEFRRSDGFAIGEDIRVIVGDRYIHDNQ